MSLSTDDMTHGLKTDLSQENSQRVSESETCLQEEDSTTRFSPDLQLEEDIKMKDLQMTENKMINPLSLFKEDFSHFKEELISVFKEKDARSQSAERENKSVGTLSLLKEDFSQFREDLTNVFKIRVSKEKDNKTIEPKEDFKTNVLPEQNTERTGRSRKHHSEENLDNLSGKDQTGRSKTGGENIREFKNSLSEKKREETTLSKMKVSGEEETDAFRRNLSKKNEEKMTDSTDSTLNPKDDSSASELDINFSADRTSSETQQTEDRILPSKTDEMISDSEDCSVTDESSMTLEDLMKEAEEDDNPLKSLPWGALASGTRLFMENDSNRHIVTDESEGELWSVKKFACYLTLDPNTANTELLLSEHNRTATRVWSDHHYPDHPDRFDGCPQVLCREGLLEKCYWEVEWRGGADVGITYNSISRDGDAASCLLGHNAKSWSLECSEGSYTPCHDRQRFRASSPRPFAHRVGIYLDWAAGCVSFYSISPDIMTHLHTFSSTFTEPLYPAFWIWGSDALVSLRQVELDWERLLQ